jgi:Outer membrane protein beta-barrel domain
MVNQEARELKKSVLVIIGLSMIMGIVSGPAMAEFGIGGGISYNRQLGDLRHDEEWKKDYVSYVLSLKYQFADILGLEANLDYYPGTGNDIVDYTLRPMGTVVISIPLPVLDLFNVGAGINSTYTNFNSGGGKDAWSDLSYHYKAGIQLPLTGLLWICGDCYYFVDDLKNIEDFDSDLLTFGARALLRF